MQALERLGNQQVVQHQLEAVMQDRIPPVARDIILEQRQRTACQGRIAGIFDVAMDRPDRCFARFSVEVACYRDERLGLGIEQAIDQEPRL